MPAINKLTINNITYDVADTQLRTMAQDTATTAQQNVTSANDCVTNAQTQLQTQNATAQTQETQLTELENRKKGSWRETQFELNDRNVITCLPQISINDSPKAIIYDTALIIPYATAKYVYLENINGRVSLRDTLLLKISKEDAQTSVFRYLPAQRIKRMLNIDLNNLNSYFNVDKVNNADGTIDYWLRRTNQALPTSYRVGQRITIYIESRVAILVDNWFSSANILVLGNQNS